MELGDAAYEYAEALACLKRAAGRHTLAAEELNSASAELLSRQRSVDATRNALVAAVAAETKPAVA